MPVLALTGIICRPLLKRSNRVIKKQAPHRAGGTLRLSQGYPQLSGTAFNAKCAQPDDGVAIGNKDVAALLIHAASRGWYCLSPVCRTRCLRDGPLFRSRRAPQPFCARQSPSDEGPSSRFRGISSAVKRPTSSVFHGRPDPSPGADSRTQAAGHGRHRDALLVPPVREGVSLCPVLSWATASV